MKEGAKSLWLMNEKILFIVLISIILIILAIVTTQGSRKNLKKKFLIKKEI